MLGCSECRFGATLHAVRGDILERIAVHLPSDCAGFAVQLARLLGRSIHVEHEVFHIRPSDEAFLPRISFDSHSRETLPTAEFWHSPNEATSVDIKNITPT